VLLDHARPAAGPLHRTNGNGLEPALPRAEDGGATPGERKAEEAQAARRN
jgi:hypothetical protein